MKKIFVCTFFVLLGAQCTLQPAQTIEKVSVQLGGTWQELSDHVRRMEYFFAQDKNAAIILYEFDPAYFSFHFENTSASQTIAQWNENLQQPLMVVNGVYFHEDYSPSGFLRAQNKRIGDRMFDTDRSGLLVLSPHVAMQDVNMKELKNISFSDAAQSYPYLIKDGAVAVNEKTENFDRRTFFGISREGKIYIGIVPRTAVSLYELSRILSEINITWDAVLNLDGGASSGLATTMEAFEEIIPNYAAIPNVIVVEEKK